MPAYEVSWMDDENNDNARKSRRTYDIAPEKWRYWVIAHDGPNEHIHELELAASLLHNDLDFGFIFLRWEDGKGPVGFGTGKGTSSYFESCWLWTTIGDGSMKITTEEMCAVDGYFNAIKNCEKAQPYIYKAISEFFQLKALPRQSSMIILGYFAVIESLVAHNPKDDFDSLNHQISTKMTLLSKRFERQLDYAGQFGQLEREKILKKLYAYRSALAHGTPADFKTQFQILKDPATVLNFLKEATKLTLLFAMKEPEFLADLKKC